MKTLQNTSLVFLFIFCTNIFVWGLINQGDKQTSWGGKISSLSYSAWQAGANKPYTTERIKKDIATIAKHANAMRLYGLSNNLHKVIHEAARQKLRIYAGAWIGRNQEDNDKEIDRLIETAKQNPAITRVTVGNEALLREDLRLPQLLAHIKKVKRHLQIPVSTAEPWHVWLKHPDLAKNVDFITVHIFPYWEGIDIIGAIPYINYRYKQLQAAYPNKHIFLGEIGWPSDGQWVKGAEPSLINQAKFTKNFLNFATENKLDYSIMEAFDTPWKRKIEGTVGAHWGLWQTDHTPKFEMSGIVRESSHWLWWCLCASFLAAFPIFLFIKKHPELKLGGKLFYAALIQTCTSLIIWSVTAALTEGIITANSIAWFVLIGFQLILLALLLVDGYELTEVIWANRKRSFLPVQEKNPENAPKVSIHVPCYNEPPDMVIQTLSSLAALDYPNYEVIVIDNNTKDEEIWKPVQEYCKVLGSRFHFHHLPDWPGYKAGALNYALKHTAKDAKIIGVIDSDYAVQPNWLRATIPYFDKDEVAIVQAPQDYRDSSKSLFKRFCFWEYAGFFHIGMVQRNERNAIIQHGTMTLMRKSTLQKVKGWAEWCICEDAELGLRLFEKGYEAVYLDHSFGKGLIPDSFDSYKTQRFRWAYGAVQILKKHWQQLSHNKSIDGSKLTTGQRYHFITGWMPWFADAAHMIFVSAALFWSMLLMLGWVEFPPTVFLIPALSVFLFKIAAGQWMYRARVECGWKDRIGAAIAGMALTHVVGRAVLQGLCTTDKPFIRTPKADDKPAALQAIFMAREELTLLVLLLIAAIAILIKFEPSNQDATIWAIVLLVQTLPYWAAVTLAGLNAMAQKRA